MFKKNRKRQARVEITFRHGHIPDETPPKEIILVLPGQEFQTGISTDTLWEGDTIVKEYDWKAGFTRVYEYFYV